MIEALVDGNEFFRCSYLLIHEYDNEELWDNPPVEINWSHLIWKIKTENPMININEVAWTNNEVEIHN